MLWFHPAASASAVQELQTAAAEVNNVTVNAVEPPLIQFELVSIAKSYVLAAFCTFSRMLLC